LKQGWWPVFAVWAVVALAALFFGPQPGVHPAGTAADHAFGLHAPEERIADAQVNDLKRAAPWGRAKAPIGAAGVQAGDEPPPLTPPDWRILAVVAGESDRFVSVQQGKQPPVELRVGQRLPDGSVIRRIEADALYLVVRGNQRILRVVGE
jgi:hypothetical protein